MPNLSDILLGKLALRQELVSTAALMECMAKQHQSPNADLGQLLVERRLISAASLSDLRKAASKAQLVCSECSQSYRPDQLGNAAALACGCGGELQILLNGKPISDRIATGPTQRFKTIVLDENPTQEDQPLPPRPPKPAAQAPPTTKRFGGRLGKSFAGAFGAYEILAELGRGGMGVVYKARQPRLNRFVALKILLAGPLASRTQTERFRREAEITARLRHPGIVQIHDVGKVGEHDYFTMDFVDGTPLNVLIKRRQVPIRRAVEMAKEIAEALHHAHERGAVHRDVKPANLIVNTKGAPVLTDFGLARDMDEDEANRLTNSGSVVGTPYYMAPEQARGDRELISGWTDVYALGVVLYECLTYRVPFRAKTHLELTKKILNEPPQPPSQIEPAIELELEAIVLKAMAKDHSERYETAAAMALDLASFLEGRPTSVGATKGQRVIRELRRRSAWLLAPVLGAVLLLGAVWGAIAFFEGESTTKPPETPPETPPSVVDTDTKAQDAALEAFTAYRSARQAKERSGAYEEALERAEARTTEALSLDGQRGDLWVLRGRIYDAMHREVEANSDFLRAIEVAPKGPAAAEAGFLIAAIHDRSGRPQQARIALRAALDRAERSGPWGGLLRGRQALTDGDYEGALAQAQQAEAENPELYEVWLLKGTALRLLGRDKEGLAAFGRAARLNDKSYSAWANLGAAAVALGDLPRGVEALSRALSLRPELTEVRWVRSNAYRKLGRFKEALQDLRALERQDKDSIEILCQLAQLYMLQHSPDAAEQAADRALRLAPTDPDVYMTRAVLQLYRYDTAGAIAEVRTALDKVPTDHPQWHELERYFVSLSLLSRQTDLLDRYAKGQRLSAPEGRRGRYELLSQLALFAKNPELANLAELRKGCLAAPKDPRGWNTLFVFLIQRDAPPDQLRADLDLMLRGAPESAEIQSVAARVLFTVRDMEAGEAALKRAVALDPEDPSVIMTQAMVGPEQGPALLGEVTQAYPLRYQLFVVIGGMLRSVNARQSEVAYTAALTLMPFDLDAAFSLASLLLEDKRPEASVRLLNKQRELYAGVNAEFPLRLSAVLVSAYLAQSKGREALRVVEDAVVAYAGTAGELEARLLRVMTLARTQQAEEAERELASLEADYPGHPRITETRSRLR